jgi:REP element-mobilizing transposase RayT
MNHVHLLVQSVPKLSVTKLVTTIKNITTRELFRLHPEIKQRLWGGHIWTSGYYANTSGYYANTVGLYGNKEVIRQYIENQGSQHNYVQLHKDQLGLFE